MKPVMLPWAQGIWKRVSPGAAAWTAHALPAPVIDSNDRTGADNAALLSLAVALDVLSTRTRALQNPDDPKVLAHLTEIGWEVGALANDPTASPVRLLRMAETGQACERALVSQQLCAALAQQATLAGVPATPALTIDAASSPNMVAASLRRLEDVARQVVLEACLNLATRAVLDYRAI